MQKLAFGAAGGQHFGRVLGSVPRPDEQIDLAEVLPLPVGEPDLISDETIFLLEIVADAPDPHALVVENIGPGLRAQIGASDRADLALDVFAALDRVEDRYDTAAVGRRLQLPDTLLPGQFDESSLKQTRIPQRRFPAIASLGSSVALTVESDSDAIRMFRVVLAEGRSLTPQRNEIKARSVEVLSGLTG